MKFHLDTSSVVQLSCFTRVDEKEPLGNAHDGLHFFQESGQVESGLGANGGHFDDFTVSLDVGAGHTLEAAIGTVDDDGFANGWSPPVFALQGHGRVVEDVGLTSNGQSAVSAAEVANLATQRVIGSTFFAIEIMVIGVCQLDMSGIPSITRSGTSGVMKLNSRVMAHGIDINGPFVTFCFLSIEFSGILETDLHGGVCLATIVIDDLAESDVTPRETVGVMETGNGLNLAGLVGVEAVADGGTGPPDGSVFFMDHNGSTQNGVVAVEGQISVIVDFSDFLHIFEESMFSTQITDFVLIFSAFGGFGAATRI